MKEIKAYIQPFMLQKVTDALHAIHIRGMSVNEIKGFGKEKDEGFPQDSKADCVEFTPKVKLEIVCEDSEVDQIAKTIKEFAHTGRRGDGKIFITAMETAISIRTGVKGHDAI